MLTIFVARIKKLIMSHSEDVDAGFEMDDISFLFWRIVKIWRRQHDKLLTDLGITGSQLEILSAIRHLSEQGKEVTQVLISGYTLIDPMTTSTTLRNLQKKKIITRKPSSVDTRAIVVEFTKEGEKSFDEAVKRLNKERARLHEHIDEKVLIRQLRKFLDIMILLDEENKEITK